MFGERALGALPDHLEEKNVEDAVRMESVAREQSVEVNREALHVKPEKTK